MTTDLMQRNISNSEVSTWLACRLQYEFAFVRNLAPKVTPKPLSRGTLGHLAFENYITARLNSSSHESSLKAAEETFTKAAQGGVDIATVLETKSLFNRYMGFHEGWPDWKLLGTEQLLVVKITDSITLPIRYDLMVEEIKSGRRLVGDFKFTYDFWRPDEHQLNSQMPKYISVLNSNGQKVDGGFLEEVRTRPLGKEKSSDHRNLWRRTYYYPSIAKKRNALKQHISASMEIMEYRSLPDDERDYKAIPVLNKHGACKVCNFKSLCASKLDGKDIEYDIKVDFIQNTYGYNKTEPEEMELEDII